MTKYFVFLCALSSISLCGCTAKKTAAEPQVIKVDELAQDFPIPQQLFKIVETELLGETKVLVPVFSYTSLQVLFTEKTAKTLTSPNLLYMLPKGGGQIDLQNVVAGQGSFFLSFPAEQFENLPPLSHLYYLSLAPKINIDSEEFGLGCGKWIDLRDKFSELNKNNFLNLNTSDNRHLFVAAGHYVFVFRKLNQVVLAQMTLVDTKNSFLLCPQVNQMKGAAL